MKYIARNLEEVAAAFDARAAQAQRLAEHANTATERRRADVEGFTWAAAAAWLREVEIRPEAVEP